VITNDFIAAVITKKKNTAINKIQDGLSIQGRNLSLRKWAFFISVCTEVQIVSDLKAFLCK
jgi:hypothetical protein